MDRPYTIRRVRRVLNAKAFTDTIGFRDSLQPDDLKGFWKGVNSKALTAREREVWFKLVRNFTPTRSLQFHQKHDDSPACLVCGAPKDDREHYFFDCVDSRNVWIAARGVLCDALGLDTIDNTHYTAVQRMFGLPKLKASLRDQEGAGRTIEIFTGLVLEMISSGRWGMQKWGTRMEGVGRRRIILEERLKLRAGGEGSRGWVLLNFDKGATEEGSRSKGSQEIKYNGLNSQTMDKKRRGNKREERTKLPGKGGKTKGKGLCQAQRGLSQINHSKRSPQGQLYPHIALGGFFSSTARVEKLYRDSTRWGAVVAAARVTVPTIKSELLTLPELLSLPPRLPSLYAEGAQHAYDDADAVAKFAQIADLYWRDEGKGWALCQDDSVYSKEVPPRLCAGRVDLTRDLPRFTASSVRWRSLPSL
ncbi:BZ3500_MvSof-1268-A1-R1_Chr1-3g01537 [Microbotryum saponariae]|uniref:BZ3500_MvSof-1268-A1-R1_Chr1-3g01537 protein n=1 Tax=Microbotryum saponariae TaxID=289078 RepID=A0A2X0K994_9BASI|nr:BZ3500_MvSof-1268-A1-R1_Chr1-3g01537 [Microbotryum saponariae]